MGVAADRDGRRDLAAWQRLLANLPFQDPRRSLAASRVGQLRATRGVRTDPRACNARVTPARPAVALL